MLLNTEIKSAATYGMHDITQQGECSQLAVFIHKAKDTPAAHYQVCDTGKNKRVVQVKDYIGQVCVINNKTFFSNH